MKQAQVYLFLGIFSIGGKTLVESCLFRSWHMSTSPAPSLKDDLHLDKETISVVQQTLVKTLISLGKLKFHCPRENGSYPDMLDCRKYYNCTNLNYTLGECESGRGFETQTKTCIPAEAVPLCQRVAKLSDHKCSNDTGLKTYDGDCQKFILCTGEAAFSSSCNHGDAFDPKYMLCLPEGKVNCTSSNLKNNSSENNGMKTVNLSIF